nr:hypothetical protein [Tanacetum cinerariifolium]
TTFIVFTLHLFHDEWVTETYFPESVEGVEPAEEVDGGDERVVTKRLSNSFVDLMDPPYDVDSVEYRLNMSYKKWQE